MKLLRNPPMVVKDLFEDIKDGIVLIALLEVLSGQKLPCEQGRKLKRIHGVANIGTALKFLEGRRVSFRFFSTSSVDSVVSSETASPPSKRKVFTKVQGSAKKALLKWVQYTAARQTGIEVKDFGQSWRSGIAFHSVIHAIRPELVDLEKAKTQSNKKNLEEAFTIAESELGIPRLLDPEDVDVDKPDEKSIMTYIAQFLKHYPDPHNTAGDAQETNSFKHYKAQYEAKRKQVERAIQSLRKDGKLSLDQALVKQAWDKVTSQVSFEDISLPTNFYLWVCYYAWLPDYHDDDGDDDDDDDDDDDLFEWHLYLDKSLPAPLGPIAAWLCRAETSLREDISIQQSHEETADTLHRKLEQHK
ncbi:Nesprin-1, partial [Ophiophagus hannah]